MRCLHKIAITLALVLLAPLAHSQTRATQTHHRTLRPEPRFNAHRNFTFTAAGSDIGVRLGATIQWHQLSWITTGTLSQCSVQVDSSPDGVTWNSVLISASTCTSTGSHDTVNGTATFIRLHMTAFTCTSASCSVAVTYLGFNSNPGGGGGGTPNVQPNTLHGNNTTVVGPPVYFTVTSPTNGDISFTGGSGGQFSVNALHFGSTGIALSPTSPTTNQCLQYNGTNIVGGTCGGGGGGGNVTATPPLTSPFLPKATSTGGNSSTIADSLFSDNGALGLYTGPTFGVGAGDTSCGGIAGCVAFTEGTTTIFQTPTGHQWLRADSASHSLKAANSGAEYFIPQLTNVGQAGQPILSNGNGTFTAVDPLISFNKAVLFNNLSVLTTGATQTGQAVSNPLGSGYGVLSIVPQGVFSAGVCTISLYSATVTTPGNVGGNLNATPFAAITFAFNSSLQNQSFPVVPDPSTGAGAGQGGDSIYATLTCSTPPGNGAGITAVLNPGITAGPPFTCNRKVIFSASTAGTTQLVAAVSNTKIYVCGWTVNTASTASVDVQLVQGGASTSAPFCPGSTPFSELLALQSLTNTQPVGMVNNAPSNVVDATLVGQALCVTLTGIPNNQVSGKLWYAQF